MISYFKNKYNSMINYLKDKHNRKIILIIIFSFIATFILILLMIDGLTYENDIRQEKIKNEYENYEIYDDYLEYEKANN